MSHCGPTREGNPGWGRFPAGGVLPPVSVKGLEQLGGGTGLLSRGESRCRASPPQDTHTHTHARTRVGKLRPKTKSCSPGGMEAGVVAELWKRGGFREPRPQPAPRLPGGWRLSLGIPESSAGSGPKARRLPGLQCPPPRRWPRAALFAPLQLRRRRGDSGPSPRHPKRPVIGQDRDEGFEGSCTPCPQPPRTQVFGPVSVPCILLLCLPELGTSHTSCLKR